MSSLKTSNNKSNNVLVLATSKTEREYNRCRKKKEQYPATVYLPHYQWSGRVLYPYILQILDAFASGIRICTGNREVFRINPIGSFKLNNSMMTQHKNFKNISGGSRNDALPMYILYNFPNLMKLSL
jgi:hypothetical protein